MAEPILSREEVDVIAKAVVPSFAEWTASCAAFAAAIESALLEKLCGEPVYQVGDGNELWRDVEKDEFDLTHHARIVYALNRSKA